MRKFGLVPTISRGEKIFLNDNYLKFIENNGMIPVTVPMRGVDDISNALEFLSMLPTDECFLLLPGGLDMDPTTFGYENVASVEAKPWIDVCESSLLSWALTNDVPVFGICRGFQLFFVDRFGPGKVDYWQHIDDHRQKHNNGSKHHSVTKTSNAFDFLRTGKKNKLFVNSFHHQAIQLGPDNAGVEFYRKPVDIDGFKILPDLIDKIPATKGQENTYFVEAARVYDKNNKLIFAGVQWHPEELPEHKNLINDYFWKNA